MLDKYKSSAIEAITSGWISNYGVYVKNCEQMLCDKFNVKHCILMNNGTASTHCLIMSLKFKYPNIRKLYVPNCVFVAAWNCPLMEYDSSELEVLKINPDTYNIDITEEYWASLEKNSAVIIVHNLGNIVNVPNLKKMRPDIIFIEDNCEGFTGKYYDEYSGMSQSSLCSSVSFYANKSITTGEGGAFFTNHTDVFDYIKSVYSHGMTEKRYVHNQLAFNYRMTNVQAAFLYDQLLDLTNIMTMKKAVFDTYDELLKELYINGTIQKLDTDKTTTSSNWMYCIVVPNLEFEALESFMNKNLIQIRPFFYDISYHSHLNHITRHDDGVLSVSGVMLPSFPDLNIQELRYISVYLKEFLMRELN